MQLFTLGATAPRAVLFRAGDLLKPRDRFALPQSAQRNECGELAFARSRLVVLPIVDRQRRNADELRIIRGREPSSPTLSPHGASREPLGIVEFLRGVRQRFRALRLQVADSLFLIALLPL